MHGRTAPNVVESMKRALMIAISCAALAIAQTSTQVSEQARPDGKGVPPPLFWVTETPAGPSRTFGFHWETPAGPGIRPDKLQSYVIVLRYVPPSNGKTDNSHWTAYSLPGTAKGFPEEPVTGIGPGPGAESIAHYLFEFYALDTQLYLPSDMSDGGLMRAIAGHTIAQTKWFDRAAPAQ